MSIDNFKYQDPTNRDIIPVFIIDGLEYYFEALTKEQVEKFSDLDKDAYSRLLQSIRSRKSPDETVYVKINSSNQFSALLRDGTKLSVGS